MPNKSERGSYGQFCPVAMAAEIVCNRWTALVMRELLCGTTRFNDLARGLPGLSRSLLTKRLRQLEQAGLVERLDGNYLLTEAGNISSMRCVTLWRRLWCSQSRTREPCPEVQKLPVLQHIADRSPIAWHSADTATPGATHLPQTRSNSCSVSSFSTFPVFSVDAGSKSRIQRSSSATGLCSTPRGTTMNSPSWSDTVLSRNSMRNRPFTTRNISSSFSC